MESRFVVGELALPAPVCGLRVELLRETAAEGGREEREDLERAEDVDGAAEARRETAGEGGAGRLEVREREEGDVSRAMPLPLPVPVERETVGEGGTWNEGLEGVMGVVGVPGIRDADLRCCGMLGRVVEYAVGVVASGEEGSECRDPFPFPWPFVVATGWRWKADGVGVVGVIASANCGAPFACGAGGLSDVPASASSSLGTLAFLLARPAGGGLTANSWAPGIGGGRKDDDGEGKGEDEGGASTQRDSGRRSLLCAI